MPELRALGYRAWLTLINIFFPPLTVMILTGLEMDTLVNSVLFLCGVLPSHVHGFYLSCTYFHRRSKVRKGRYPGGRKSFIYSDKIINGGASNAEIDELYRKVRGLEKRQSVRKSQRSGRRMSQTQANTISRADSAVVYPQRSASHRSARPTRTNSRASAVGYQGSGVARVNSRASAGYNGAPIVSRTSTRATRVGSMPVGNSPVSPVTTRSVWG